MEGAEHEKIVATQNQKTLFVQISFSELCLIFKLLVPLLFLVQKVSFLFWDSSWKTLPPPIGKLYVLTQ